MTRLSETFVDKMKFRMIKSIAGQHSFWEELGGMNRIAIADQSIIRRDGSFIQPQFADNGLLLIDFHTLCDNKYVMPCNTLSERATYAFPVVDRFGSKYTIILIQSEYDWFMEKFALPQKATKPESILVEKPE